jgi:phosphoribosylformylglycinamidine synthase
LFLPKGITLRMVVAHAEGNYVPRNQELHRYLAAEGFVALRYAEPSSDGRQQPAAGRYPDNPNGSLDDVAGLTDRSGRVLGLMPHPDRSYLEHHMPNWTRGTGIRSGPTGDGDGAEVFRGMVALAGAER